MMTEEALILMKKAVKVHQKIKRRQFKSVQDGLRLTSLETAILKNLMMRHVLYRERINKQLQAQALSVMK